MLNLSRENDMTTKEAGGTVHGPDFIALQVSDLESSTQFWAEKVGLVPVPKSPPGAVVFATQPIPFAITTPKIDLKASSRLGWGVALWMHTDNAEALCARLRKHGVRILSEPADGNFGRQFSFADPDGYAIVAHDGR
jgi:catechol 2,3-dioxygenase-like lactoylglutathione lyase family enzyme